MEATTLISTIPTPTLPSSHRSSKHRARRPSTALALVSTEGTEKAGRRVSELSCWRGGAVGGKPSSWSFRFSLLPSSLISADGSRSIKLCTVGSGDWGGGPHCFPFAVIDELALFCIFACELAVLKGQVTTIPESPVREWPQLSRSRSC